VSKIRRQIIVQEIVKLILDGKSYLEVLSLIEPKCAISRATFTRYWKEAGIKAIDERIEMESLIHDATIHLEIESRARAIMTANERREFLTKVARGEIKFTIYKVVDKTLHELKVSPGFQDRIKAIAELNKMDGDYAPIKVSNTDSKGKDITVFKWGNRELPLN